MIKVNQKMHIKKQRKLGFTIVELISVIVIIGILATISFVSYNGVQAKARDTSVLSDIDNMDSSQTNYGLSHGGAGKAYYSSTGYDSDLGFTPNSGNVIDVVVNSADYCIRGYNLGGTKNSIFNSFTKESTSGICDSLTPSLVATDPTNWLAIGTQVWAKANLNVGTMVTGVTAQTNNSTTEKYCYNDTESNCTTYGALYQWDEAMQYVITEKAQGICPVGSHIPTDAEYKTLEMKLGMTQAAADATGWRGTDQGTQLKPTGLSGLNIPLAGFRNTDGSFQVLSSNAYPWSSSDLGASGAYIRLLDSGNAMVYRSGGDKRSGFSVRCILN